VGWQRDNYTSKREGITVRLRILCCLCLACLLASLAVSAQEEGNAGEVDLPVLQVWLPVPLVAGEASAAYHFLREHTDRFSSNTGIEVVYRTKNVGTVGGITATIRAGKEVAPAALPDVALVRRRDLTATHARQFLHSFETLFSSALLKDLDDGVEFGQISLDDAPVLYGLPYLYDMLISVHTQPLAGRSGGLRFEDVLENQATFYFPAARSSGLHQTVYLQVLTAGEWALADSVPAIEADALQVVLGFYAELAREGLLAPDVLSYTAPSTYIGEFAQAAEQQRLGIFAASDYFALLEQGAEVSAAQIPTLSGAGASILDGWLWVLVAPESSRQALSARLLEWLMEPGFHAEFARALYHLPAQPALLPESLPSGADLPFFTALLENAALPPATDSEGSAASRVMQEALILVLQGEESVTEAAKRAIGQMAER